jgi:hypothetical protein
MSGGEQTKHGSESYFVVGEGLLGESGSGRTATANGGLAAPPPFRFSRIGPKGTTLNEATRKKIANAMTPEGGAASDIPLDGVDVVGRHLDVTHPAGVPHLVALHQHVEEPAGKRCSRGEREQRVVMLMEARTRARPAKA